MTVNADVLKAIDMAVIAGDGRDAVTKRVAEIIREAGRYRWVGIYEVTEPEIAAIGWTGSEAPAYLRFPVTRGLTGAAVKSRAPVVVADVAKDARYLAFFTDTRSEMIVPVINEFGVVIGTINVESERVNAFSEQDVKVAEQCAKRIAGLFLTAK